MRRGSRSSAALALLFFVAAHAAHAADIRVLSAGAVEPGLAAFAQLVDRALGDTLRIQYGTAPRIAERLAAGDAYDILIAPRAVLDEAAMKGWIVPESRVPVGRVAVGVVVRNGAPVPDVATVAALRSALLAADTVVYNTASTGLYLDQLFARLGVLAELAPKTTRYPDGAAVMEHLARGTGNEIGFGAMTEIRLFEPKGLRLAGPLPADVQNYTGYEAAITGAVTVPVAARAALALLATPAGKAAFVAGGVE